MIEKILAKIARLEDERAGYLRKPNPEAYSTSLNRIHTELAVLKSLL